MLVEAGWQVGCDRVQRIWRREGLKVPSKQKPRGRLWLNDESCIRLRPQHRNHVWSYDFVEAQTHDGRKLRLMTLIDEFTRECLAIRVARPINSFGVIDTMVDVMLARGVPEHIRSDNGAEQPMALGGGVQFLGQPPADLIEDQANERLGAVDVGWRHDEVEADWLLAADKIGKPALITGSIALPA